MGTSLRYHHLKNICNIIFLILSLFQEEIYTTSFLSAAYLKSIGFSKKVYLYGTKGIADELENFGIDYIGLGVSNQKNAF